MKAKVVRALKVLLAMVGSVIILALIPLPLGDLVPPIAAGCGVVAFWFTRSKSVQSVPGGPKASSNTVVTSQSIKQGQHKLTVTTVAFGAGLAGIMFWLYSSSEGQRHTDYKVAVLDKTQEMLGPNFNVESVSLPSGIGSYETIAVVIFQTVADGKRDSLTMLTTGNCRDVCRIRMDPRDALRLAPLR